MEESLTYHIIESFGFLFILVIIGLYVNQLKKKHNKIKSEIEELKKHSDIQSTDSKGK